VESNRKVLKIAEKYDIVKPALGIYPEYAINMPDEEIDKEIAFIREARPIAIGEVGLDGHRIENPERQKEVFKRFIRLAKSMDIPLIVHSRKMENEVYELLAAADYKKIIIHCFGGEIELAKKMESLGFMFSIPTKVCRSGHFKELVRSINSTHLLTETDSPFLAHKHGMRNEPAYIIEGLKKIAEIKGIELEEAKRIIFMNYKRIFG